MKQKYIFTIYLLLLNMLVLFSQNTIGTILNTVDAYDGLTLFTVSKDTYLINNCGQVVNKWTGENDSGKSVYLLAGGNLLRAEHIENEDVSIPGIGGKVTIRDWDNNLIWEYNFSDALISQHHDVFPLSNGNILVLIVERKNQDEAILAGRDPSTLADGELYNEKIIEIQPVGSNEINQVWEWNTWDHLIQDFDNSKNNFGDVLNNPQLLDINFLSFSNGNSNWMHVNSIQYNEKLDQIILSARQLNEIYIIDHSTTSDEAASHEGGLRGKGGDFLYRWGNPLAYKAGDMNDQKLFGQHFPHWIPDGLNDGGNILVFNNGFNRLSDFSSVDILIPATDQDNNYLMNPGEKTGPEDFEWSYLNSADPTIFYSKILSSAQRLPNGNTLICEGTKGHFFEIDGNDNIVWKYISPINNNGPLTQGDEPVVKNIFRASKYSPDDAVFNGKGLTPGNPIELNFNNDNCDVLSTELLDISKYNIYPNPSSQNVFIQSSGNIDKIEIYNIQGMLLKIAKNQNSIEVNELDSGIYLIRFYKGLASSVKKIIIE